MSETPTPQQEIRDAIAYYEERGWDWVCVVGFLACRALGCLPQDVLDRYHKTRTVKSTQTMRSRR